MTNMNLPDRPEPCPSLNAGHNNTRTWVILGFIVLAIAWFFAIHVYGMIINPYNRLANGEFLRSEVTFDLIPALPDTLAESYELLNDGQREKLVGYGWVDEDSGIAWIPVEDAFEALLTEGFPVGTDTATAEDETEESEG